MTLSALVDQMGGELIGRDVEFSQLSTDTRKISTGDAFLALVGEHFDGNEFIEQAKQRGASAAIVSRQLESDLPMLRVADTHHALGQIALENRNRSKAKVIALTGSQGKTTVKEMLGTILGSLQDTLITQANLNNTIGVPLTLLQLNENHRFAVIEMGADRKGEIAFSTRLALPDIALITNANATHLEGFGSLTGIVAAKGEITEGLSQQGVLLLNADDAHVGDWIKLANGRRVVLFSYDNQGNKADFYGADVSINDRAQVGFSLITPLGNCDIEMKLLGKHTVLNAVAAAAAAIEAGAELAEVGTALASMKPINGRLCPLQGVNQCWLIDDTYNASPSSFKAAIDVLMSFSGKKILVAGDMKELGSVSAESHIALGRYAKSAGVDHLWAVGELSQLTVKAFGDAAIHCKEKDDLVKLCREGANSAVVFLVKGSRGAHMDSVVNEIRLYEDN